jgi:microcystin-dependent protein
MPANLPDLTHGIKQVAVGLVPNDGLGDDLRTAFIKVNHNANVSASYLKEKIVSNKSLYVSITGNDNNPGTVNLPFRTINRAVQEVQQTNFNGLKVRIYVKAGVYTEQVYLNNPLDSASTSSPEVILTNHNNDEVILELPANASSLIEVSQNARLNITNIKFRATPNPLAESVYLYSNNGVLEINNVEFRDLLNGYHISLYNKANLYIQASYSVTGLANAHLKVSDYSKVISLGTHSIAFSSQAFTNFVEAYNYSIVDLSKIVFSGNPTGKRFSVDSSSKLVLPTSFPSNLSPGEYLTETKLPSIIFSGLNNTFSGTATFNNAVTFNSGTNFTNTVNFSGNVTVANGVSTATLLTNDNTNKFATCEFVQRVSSTTLGTVTQIPTGSIMPYGGTSAPTGWLLADGTEYLITNYPALFAVIGTLYGGNGITTFRVPDFRGRTPIGRGQGTSLTNRSLGQTGGAESVALSVNELASHSHGVTDAGHSHGTTDPGHSHPIIDLGHSHNITDPGHNHIINDPGHTHNITDPGHIHGISDPGHAHGVTDAGHAHSLYPFRQYTEGNGTRGDGAELTTVSGGSNIYPNTALANAGVSINASSTGVLVNNNATNVSVNSITTGISVNNMVTSISINGGTTGLTVDNDTTELTVNNAASNITVNDNGSGAAHNNMQPWLCINFLIKT